LQARGSTIGEADRRRGVLRALFRLICEKGYSNTSLADLAAASGMSASHLLYYFPGKDAVLAELLDLRAQNILRDVLSLHGDSPDEVFDALADYFFGGAVMTRPEQGAMLELFGLSTHDRRLWRIKSNFDAQMNAYLTAIFRRTSGAATRPADESAETALAVLVGLLTSSYFEEHADPPRARRLFRQALARLAAPLDDSAHS
jgi:AcrR family transcriptional regulator